MRAEIELTHAYMKHGLAERQRNFIYFMEFRPDLLFYLMQYLHFTEKIYRNIAKIIQYQFKSQALLGKILFIALSLK